VGKEVVACYMYKCEYTSLSTQKSVKSQEDLGRSHKATSTNNVLLLVYVIQD
jgi:hypothetical protein